MSKSGGGGGSSTSSINQTTKSDIHADFKPYFTNPDYGILPLAADAVQRTPGVPYSGNFVSGTNQQDQAIAGLFNPNNTGNIASYAELIANQGMGQAGNYFNLGDPTIKMAQDTIEGKYLDPTNPLYTSALSAILNPMREDLDRRLMRYEDMASGQGAFGGSGMNELVTDALVDWERTAGETGAKFALENFARERGLQFQAPNILGQGVTLNTAPASMYSAYLQPYDAAGKTLSSGANYLRGVDQLDMQNALARFEEQTYGQYRHLFPYGQLLSSLPIPTNTTTTGTQYASASGPEKNMGAGAAQGALGGAAMGTMVMPGWGTAIGAVAGGLLGAFA